VFDERTTSTYKITTSLPKPKLTHKQYAVYAEINTFKNKEILENFNVASFFRRALNLEEDAADGKMEKDVSYTLYIAESKRHECPKFRIRIGGVEVSALLDTGCELSILNEQLYNKLRLLGLNCLELPTQHLNLVSAFNERSKRIRKQALLGIQIGDSRMDQVVLLSPQLLTHAILGRDFLIDHAAELSFPDRTVSLKINEKFCRLEFQGAREATRQEVAES
jgi:predicted aspartyl protease